MSPNVEYLGSIQQDVGLTTGAKVIGGTDGYRALSTRRALSVFRRRELETETFSSPESRGKIRKLRTLVCRTG
jgi:hypothetical protein